MASDSSANDGRLCDSSHRSLELLAGHMNRSRHTDVDRQSSAYGTPSGGSDFGDHLVPPPGYVSRSCPSSPPATKLHRLCRRRSNCVPTSSGQFNRKTETDHLQLPMEGRFQDVDCSESSMSYRHRRHCRSTSPANHARFSRRSGSLSPCRRSLTSRLWGSLSPCRQPFISRLWGSVSPCGQPLTSRWWGSLSPCRRHSSSHSLTSTAEILVRRSTDCAFTVLDLASSKAT